MDGCKEGSGKNRREVRVGEWIRFTVADGLGIWRRASKGESGGVWGDDAARQQQ